MTTRCIDNPVELTVLPEIPAKYGDCCLIMTSCSGRMAWSCPDFVFTRSCSALGLKGRRRLRPDVALQGGAPAGNCHPLSALRIALPKIKGGTLNWLETPPLSHVSGLSRRGCPSLGAACAAETVQHLESGSVDIESIQIHHLGPRCHEVVYELLLRVCAAVDLGQSA